MSSMGGVILLWGNSIHVCLLSRYFFLSAQFVTCSMDIHCIRFTSFVISIGGVVEMLWCLDGVFAGGCPYIGNGGDKGVDIPSCRFFLIGYETRNHCKMVTKSCLVAICITSLGALVH